MHKILSEKIARTLQIVTLLKLMVLDIATVLLVIRSAMQIPAKIRFLA